VEVRRHRIRSTQHLLVPVPVAAVVIGGQGEEGVEEEMARREGQARRRRPRAPPHGRERGGARPREGERNDGEDGVVVVGGWGRGVNNCVGAIEESVKGI
jgi:hypothetical protein